METNDNSKDFLVISEGKKYLQGFNDGYLLAENMPELLATLEQLKTKTPHIEGVLDGIKEFQAEKQMTFEPSVLKSKSRHSRDHDETPQRDRGKGHEID